MRGSATAAASKCGNSCCRHSPLTHACHAELQDAGASLCSCNCLRHAEHQRQLRGNALGLQLLCGLDACPCLHERVSSVQLSCARAGWWMLFKEPLSSAKSAQVRSSNTACTYARQTEDKLVQHHSVLLVHRHKGLNPGNHGICRALGRLHV